MKNILLDNLQIIKKWTLKNEVELKKILEKIQQQEQKIKDLKSNQFQKKDIKIELEKEKHDVDFFNQIYKFKSDLSPNIGLDNDFEQSFKKAEKINNLNIDLYVYKGICFANLDETDNAKNEFSKALKISIG